MTRPDLRWGERTYVMGILNLTTDSFSGDGLADGRDEAELVEAALEQARDFVDAGADILDVGAESSDEVALSVVAALMAERRGFGGGLLHGVTGRIHDPQR